MKTNSLTNIYSRQDTHRKLCTWAAPPTAPAQGEGRQARSTLVMGLVNSNQGVQGQKTLKHYRTTHNITKTQTEAGSMHSVPCVGRLAPRESAAGCVG